VFFCGGEVVVPIGDETGVGGRNQELVLSTVPRIAGSKGIVIGSVDSDGTDGPTDVAGGMVDGSSMVVRGSIVRQGSGHPVEGQVVEGRIAGIAHPFTTRTNERGNFALRLQPPAPVLNADSVPVPLTVDVTLRFVGTGIPDETLNALQDMHTHVLPAEVEIP